MVVFDILSVDRLPADTSVQIDFTASRNSYFPPNPIPILMGVSAREKWLGLQMVISRGVWILDSSRSIVGIIAESRTLT